MAKMPAEIPKPVPIALVVCDDVYKEPRGKQALVGLFNRIVSTKFPTIHPAFCVFVSVTEVMPGTRCKIDIVHAESDHTVALAEAPMPAEGNPIGICDMVFRFERVVFPEAGKYYIRLFGNESIFSSALFM